MKFLLSLFFIFVVFVASAQIVNQSALPHYPTVKESYSYNSEKMTAFKERFIESDTISSALLNFKIGKGNLQMNPTFDFGLGYQNSTLITNEENVVSTAGFGVDIRFKRKKWNTGFTSLTTNSNYMLYQRIIIGEFGVAPSTNVVRGSERYTSDYFAGFVNFKANEVFNFELGYGKNFIGDGYRSLLLQMLQILLRI